MTTDTPIDIGTLITLTPGVQGGMPCVAGTRVPVHEIALMHRDGTSTHDIAEQFSLPVSHVYAAIAYYLVNREYIDADLADENVLYEQQAQEHRPLAS